MLQCERQIPTVSGLKDQEITVGRHVFFTCTGDYDKAFDFSVAKVLANEKDNLKIKIIKAEARSASQFDVDLVFYSATEFMFPDLIITDGNLQLSLGQQNFKVQTVIEKSLEGKPPEPFGPVLPLKLSWPVNYSLIIVGVVIAVLVVFIWNIRKRYRYRQLLAKLKDYEATVTPDLQFYKSIRKAELNSFKMSELDNAFRLYILRRYNVPAFDLKNPSLLRFMKKNSPWLKKERLELKKILSDIQSTSDTETEKKALIKKMYQFVDSSEALKQRSLQ